ncbi:MAG TPA: hypothetical protein VFV23_07100 [Verrucomicrobiae bacterium]|nr:hypothetical protein [Verrucomicrobiae bacterium]
MKPDSTVQSVNNSTSVEKSCDECGRAEAIEIGDQFLCADCISNNGSSCAGAACYEEN